jgi:hypothetical protein
VRAGDAKRSPASEYDPPVPDVEIPDDTAHVFYSFPYRRFVAVTPSGLALIPSTGVVGSRS